MLDAVSENLRFHGQVYGNVQAQFHGILTITNNMMVWCDLTISTYSGAISGLYWNGISTG